MWLGPKETVVVNDFDLIQEIGSRDDLIDRPVMDFFVQIRGGYVSALTRNLMFARS